MNGEYLLYLQEIKDTEWVIELISEQFDDAINMMTKNSVIYGGAVRDCLAGKDLIGDLDIAVSASECNTMINKFVKNPKWVNISNNNRISAECYKKFGTVSPFFTIPSRKSVFQTAPQIMTFRTLGNKTVQIIILSPTDNDPFQTVTTMVKQVDIVCCGVILTNDNKVFEVVPNAYKDCKKHVLRLNNVCYVKDVDNFKQRIEKLSERGWINEININKVVSTVNRKRKQKIEHEKSIAGATKRTSTGIENHTHNIKRSNFVDANNKDTVMENGYIVLRGPYTAKEGATGVEIHHTYANGTDQLSHTGYRFTLSSSDVGHIGGFYETLQSLEVVAKKYRLDMVIQPVKSCLVLTTKNRYISNQVYNRVMGKTKHFKKTISLPRKNLEDVASLSTYITSPDSSIKKKYKLSTTTEPYNNLEAATMTYGELHEQTSKKIGISKASIPSPNRKRGSNGTKTPRVERYFNHSTDVERSVTVTADKHYYRISRADVVRGGGTIIILSHLEKLAKRFKIDVGVIIEHGTATLITRDEYTSRHVYELLINGNGSAPETNTKSFGGTVRWR